MYASCIIHICIMATCIRIKNICIIHPTPRIALFVRSLVRYRKISHHRYMHHTYTHASGSRIEDHRYVHHTHMHQSQGSRNIINASYTHVSGSCILLLESPCSFVGPLVPKKYRIIYTYTSPDSCIIRIMEQNHRFVHCASYICASYIHASG